MPKKKFKAGSYAAQRYIRNKGIKGLKPKSKTKKGTTTVKYKKKKPTVKKKPIIKMAKKPSTKKPLTKKPLTKRQKTYKSHNIKIGDFRPIASKNTKYCSICGTHGKKLYSEGCF